MTAHNTGTASMVLALARMDGVVLTAHHAAQDTANDAAVTESASRASATATQDGPDMLAIFVLACTTALSTDIATTELASAKRDTVDVTAHCRLSPSPASAPFTVFVVACSSALRFTRHKVLDPHTSATQSALKSAFLSVLRARCQ
jgi:hypothetical protein